MLPDEAVLRAGLLQRGLGAGHVERARSRGATALHDLEAAEPRLAHAESLLATMRLYQGEAAHWLGRRHATRWSLLREPEDSLAAVAHLPRAANLYDRDENPRLRRLAREALENLRADRRSASQPFSAP